MRNEKLRKLSCMVLAVGTLLGLAGCGAMSSKSFQKEEIIASNVDYTAKEYDREVQN